jgi:hypothetical protein
VEGTEARLRKAKGVGWAPGLNPPRLAWAPSSKGQVQEPVALIVSLC